ncbi:MAG: 1-(5-phosphoribosyl)-5-[(5-phosphoribosylamino)methylideneamino]imidazole-4-carboxamide isomerase [Candidatus Omnitrophica bacterium]|nr:1-(5-phosphoribosyl)-5-[(5-phosphoribosylamino)methylideneamino]imidazole-4-carboxamide isomerase [Candidatus Omnitrophota bacterium]
MIVIPAIDIMDGKVVRLKQGKFQEVTVYSEHPFDIAQQWIAQGAQFMHIVDLDGAATGQIKNLAVINSIIRYTKAQVQVGGGIRDIDTIQRLFSVGAASVVLGTKVIEDKDFLKKALETWPDKIIVSIDASHGKLAKEGWTSISTINATDFAKELQDMGVKGLIYTDISRDGMLKGPNIDGIKSILDSVDVPLVASGGISSLADLKKLKELEKEGLRGAILGKAIYERSLSLRGAIEFCSPRG